MSSNNTELNAIALENFREYLQIPSVHPDIDYEPCVKFLTKLAGDVDLPIQVFSPVPSKPVVVITWPGTNANLPSIILNSHMDVVPVTEAQWTHPPFAAEVHEGRVYARGAQDMKCIGIQYVEAIRRLRTKGVRLARTVHCTFVPDEEIGGANGMKCFVQTPEFRALNVGVAFDEGMPSADDSLQVYYGERCMMHITFHCPGQPGHGSLLLADTAAEKVRHLLNSIMTHRETQCELLRSKPSLTIGDVMTVNVTMLSGGQQLNVLPAELQMKMDCRVPVTTDMDAWLATIDEWCRLAGDGVRADKKRYENPKPTDLSAHNPYWQCLQDVLKQMGLRCDARIFPGGTDSRFLRALGVPAFGVSPIVHHPNRLHDNDEYLTVDVFLRGIDFYVELLTAVGNLPN